MRVLGTEGDTFALVLVVVLAFVLVLCPCDGSDWQYSLTCTGRIAFLWSNGWMFE